MLGRNQNIDLVLSVNVPEVDEEESVEKVWKEASSALEVKDWGLFKSS